MPEDLESFMDMEQDAQDQFIAPSNDDLSSIAALAQEQLDLELQIIMDTAALEAKQKKLDSVRYTQIPNLLERFGMLSFKLTNGAEITVKKELRCGISEANRPAAHKWLEDTGNGGIIKTEVKVPFAKGQEDDAKRLRHILGEYGWSYTNKSDVHHSTLKAFVKRQLEAGVPIPTDLFSIFEQKVAAVTKPK